MELDFINYIFLQLKHDQMVNLSIKILNELKMVI